MPQFRTRQRPPALLPARPQHVPFDAGRLTSDGGLAWIAQADAALGLCAALAGPVPDWRHGPVQHPLVTLVRQRVFQITCGYEDQNDADTLRSDPLLKWVCGRRPESGRDLASQPTLSRLENVTRRGIVLKSSQQWGSEITGKRAHVSAMVLNTCRAVVFHRTYAVSFRQ